MQHIKEFLTFTGPCIVIYSYNKRRDALILKFIFDKELCYCRFWSYVVFLWCSYTDMFVLLVWHWWIWYSEDRASWYILIIKANEMQYFSNLFLIKNFFIKNKFVKYCISLAFIIRISQKSILKSVCLSPWRWTYARQVSSWHDKYITFSESCLGGCNNS